jgi:hypothetical protein
VRDLRTGTARRIHSNHGGTADHYTRTPVISANGRYLLYGVRESSLYLRDLKTDSPAALVSALPDGAAVTGHAVPGAVSDNGRRVAFDDCTDAFVRYLGPLG